MAGPRSDSSAEWTDCDTEMFLEYGDYFVPHRAFLVSSICDLVPVPPAGGHILDLACGDGVLAGVLLERFAGCRVHGRDGSASMLVHAAKRLHRFGDRFDPARIDLADRAWRVLPWPLHAVVSSLGIHHLDGPAKQTLFADLAAALSPRGVMVIADLVQPTRPEGIRLAARHWDLAVRERSRQRPLPGKDPFAVFGATGWNYYHDPEANPEDRPSPILDQLRMLETAGFTDLDVHWMFAGHAIFSGRTRGA